MTAYAIETDGLTKEYGRTRALEATTLRVPAGAIFALVGHNGAGKTTLIKMLMNIVRPSGGSARVLGLASDELKGEAFTRIGYVSENQELPDWMTVRGYLEYLRPFYTEWHDEGLVRALHLPLDRKLKQLSRGMAMKAALASALAFRPSLIVLDEPFSGLDPLVRDELIEALLDVVNGDRPVTILISSHDLGEIESFATHVGFLEAGRLVFAEEMGVLAGRFRAVTVAVPEGEAAGAAIPSSWLGLERGPSMAKFVHCRADVEDIAAQVEDIFPGGGVVEMEGMTLREIFLALAKAGRGPVVDEGERSGGRRA
jgi:ABC-2 type transport system ATP-binding protein